MGFQPCSYSWSDIRLHQWQCPAPNVGCFPLSSSGGCWWVVCSIVSAIKTLLEIEPQSHRGFAIDCPVRLDNTKLLYTRPPYPHSKKVFGQPQNVSSLAVDASFIFLVQRFSEKPSEKSGRTLEPWGIEDTNSVS